VTNERERVVTLDVRPVLAAGEEPLTMILEVAAGVSDGGTLELTAPFEPVPLYRLLSPLGFGYRTAVRAPDEVVVQFQRLGITPQALVGDVHTRHPETGAVLAAMGVDLCCGAGQSLESVAQAHGVELPVLLGRLQQAVMDVPPS
jgi:hypothetical protein